MSEELDFEAEVLSVFNANVTEVGALNENAIQFDPGKVEDDTIEIHSNPSELLNDASDSQSNSEEVESDTIGIRIDNEDVESDCNTVQFNTEEIQPDVAEIESDTGEIQSDTGEIQSDTGEIKPDATEIQSDNGEIQSDSGEIENGENLEEGEIEDNAPVSNKNPEETVCRYFQRGSCLYGSECRNRHVSTQVYNMFEPVLSNKINLNSSQLQKTHVPVVFPLNPGLCMPDMIDNPWERGIKNAKIARESANFRKNEEDIENDWNRCLEIAKQNIHQKAYLKRQSCDDIKPYYESKYCEQEKFQDRDPLLKRGPENKISRSYHQKSPIFSYSKYKKELNCEKIKSDVQQTTDNLKWVDPWQRSKSPRKRRKSFSLSPSPSMKRCRKGSVSSSSSSSSCFKRIYGSPHQSKSPKRFRSASRSKKGRNFKKRSYSRGHSYSKSPRKSHSKSSRRSCCSGSRSSSRTSSVSSEDAYEKKKSNVKMLPSNKLVPKNEKYFMPAEKPKDIHRSSPTKRAFNKASGRAVSPCRSDKSSSSDISMSSLSYTSISSSGKNTSKANYPKSREDNAVSRSKIDKVRHDGSRNAPTPEQGYPNSNAFNKLSKVPDQTKVMSPDRKKLLMYNDARCSKAKCDKASTFQAFSLSKPASLVSKDPIIKKVAAQKPSKAAMELLKYYSFGRSNNSASSAAQATQPKAISPMPTEATKSTTASKMTNIPTKASEVAIPKITCDVNPKPQKPVESDVVLKVNETNSKRHLLLQQLRAIEDAIARKKQNCTSSS